MFALRVWAYRQEVCALGSEQAVRRPAPQTIEQIVRNALRTNLGNNELEMLIYCFIIGDAIDDLRPGNDPHFVVLLWCGRCYVNFGAGLPAPGQALAPALSAETPAKMDALPMVGNTALSLGCAGNMLDEAKAWAESVGAQVMSATLCWREDNLPIK
ncbi:hypothetical protein PAPYR_11620 [Paratrimastix pyriformis]|uniref:Uncharacterized protein n=1 Tax=Paratrimastix pyriformis TaxID=342808 RepID=A0ABQ8U527_9EUKA|nr:hypothetical protein PAPYR_11620 [Paratrimastix pyriformis]